MVEESATSDRPPETSQMKNRIFVSLTAGILVTACGSSIARGNALDFPAETYGVGGPRQPSGINVNHWLTGTYGPDTDITVTDVRAIKTIGPVEIAEWYVVDGTVTDPDWALLPSEQQMERLAQLDRPHVQGCAEPSCDLTIGLAIRATDNSDPGAIRGFEILYEDESGSEFTQSVGFIVEVCLPERPECTNEF